MSNQDEVELHYLSNPPKEPMDLNIIKDLPEEIPEVKDSNQEIQAEEESLNLNDGKNNFRKCGITAKQLEEIYIKLDLNKRQLISVWAKDYLLPTPTIPYMRLPKNVEGVEGRIDKWYLKFKRTKLRILILIFMIGLLKHWIPGDINLFPLFQSNLNQ